jgi:hypothetical protein
MAVESGIFDGVCGPGRPKLVLTGHSKGGGQAQYAAASIKLDAVVFNSDLVNPTVSTDWLQLPYAPAILRTLIALGFGVNSICGGSHSDGKMKQYVNYLQGGGIRDIRMVNDPLVNLLSNCHLPHATVGWLANTLTCPDDGGHAIETVIRELQVCAASGQVSHP